MKKVVISAILVALCILIAVCAIGYTEAQKAKKEIVIGIISDPQIVAASEVGDDDYASFQDFNAVGQKMLFISEAILKTAVDRMIEQKVDVVIMPGDLTENGSKAGHEMVASQCARLEAAGISVYAMCGNHDINKAPKKYMKTSEAIAKGEKIYEEFADGTCSVRVSGVSPDDFMRIYHDFGFDNPVALDKLDAPVKTTVGGYTFEEVGTMSYVQDLPDSDYRLISLDAANYYEDENENTYYMGYYGSESNRETAIKGTGYSILTERLLAWLETQLNASKAAGKRTLLMAHFPINNQMGDVIGTLTDGIDNRMNMADELLELLAEYDVEYTFTGHLHTQHDATYTSEEGKKVTDIETGCLTNYPLPMRYVRFKNGEITVENEYLNSVKEAYLPAYLNNETIKTAVLTNLQSYALDPFIYDNLLYNFDRRINDDDKPYALFYKIFDMLDLDPDGTHEAELEDLADYIYNDLYMAFMKMPIYETSGKMSLESICKKYGVTLPKSNNTEVFHFFIKVLGKFYKYDYANDGGPITFDSVEGQILRNGVYSIFEVLRTSEFFTKLHAINPTIEENIISERFVEKLFKEGTLDLLCDDFLFKLATIAKPLISKYYDIDGLSASDVVGMIKFILPTGLSLVDAKFPGLYKKSDNTILGVKLDTLWTIDMVTKNGETVPVLEFYFDRILEDVVFDKVGEGILR